MPDLSIQLCGLRLANPTFTCSGTCGYAFEYADFMDLSKLGAFVTKSITREERVGNEPARIVEVRAGMLNAIGLANVGLDRFLKEKVPQIRKMPCPVIVNVAGHSFDDYGETGAAMDGLDCIAGVELNVSCPNVKDGLTFGTHPGRLRELVGQVKKVLPHKLLIVKLSPNVEDVTATARAAIEGGAQVLSLVNTFTAMSIDVHKRRPRFANVTGGLSGPAIKPIALHMVSRVYRNIAKSANVPIIGMGGIQSWRDAVEFILAGATGVAIGTALFVDPATPNRICEGIAQYMEREKIERLSDLIGALQLPVMSREQRRIRERPGEYNTRMQNIYSARDAMDAHFLKGLLAEKNIDSVVQGEELEEVWGAVPMGETNKPSVWVNEADAARAKPIIDEYERRKIERAEGGEAPARPTWKCPRCGEDIEEQFTSCWHCNTPRPAEF